MTSHVFVEKMQHEMMHALPIIVIPLIFLLVYMTLEYLSDRLSEKVQDARKYKQYSSLSAMSQTKVDLELAQLEKAVER